VSATIRDIAIIVIALETVILNALLIVLIWQIWRLVRMLRDEIRPILEDARETVDTVKGTATFVSEEVVSPVIQAGSRLAGFRRTVQVLRSEAQASLETLAWLQWLVQGPGKGKRSSNGSHAPGRPPHTLPEDR